MLEMTDAVAAGIREVLAKNPGKCLRIAVEGDGCAGPYLRLSLDEPYPGENTVRLNGIEMLLSDDVKRHAEITRIHIFLDQGADLS